MLWRHVLKRTSRETTEVVLLWVVNHVMAIVNTRGAVPRHGVVVSIEVASSRRLRCWWLGRERVLGRELISSWSSIVC